METEVTVICPTYNHEKYIGQALESFVNQKTNFKFEVIVFDDASTDRTAEVIRKYKEKYPDIIKPVYQKENLYSQKISKLPIYEQKAQGKYIAICEGDDYWISDQKLQKQYDYMEEHPECSWCIHNAVVVDTCGKHVSSMFVSDHDCDIPTEHVITGGGGFCATNSIFTHRELFLNRPDYFQILDIDYILQMHLATSGVTHCIAENLSAYRKGVESSWSQRMNQSVGVAQRRSAHARKVIRVLEAIDKYTNGQYHEVIQKKIALMKVSVCCFDKDSLGKILKMVYTSKRYITPKSFLRILYYRYKTK